MQESLPLFVANGAVHGSRSSGTPNRAGGLFANGMPNHVLTPERLMPTTGPETVLAEGPCANVVANRLKPTRSKRFAIMVQFCCEIKTNVENSSGSKNKS